MIQDVLERAWGARPIIKCSCPTWRKECDDGALIDSVGRPLLRPCLCASSHAGRCAFLSVSTSVHAQAHVAI